MRLAPTWRFNPWRRITARRVRMHARYTLSADDADKILQGARLEAAKNSWLVSIVIVDAAGAILQAYRFDDAPGGTVDAPTMKARTSLMSGRPSKDMEEFAKQYPTIVNRVP